MARNESVTIGRLIENGDVVDGETTNSGIDEDLEQSWDNLRESLRNAESHGTIRIAKIPMNDDGTPQHNVKGQTQLASYPVDMYTFDELLNVIRQRFMKPGEAIFVRMMAFESGKAGARLNRTIRVQRESAPDDGKPETQLGEVLRAMQENQRVQFDMMREMMQPQQNPLMSVRGGVDWSAVLAAAAPIAGSVLTAIIARPSRPQSDLAGMVAVFKELKDLGSGVSSDTASDDSMASIIKAVGPNALQFLSTLAANRPPSVAPVPQRVLATPVQSVPTPPGNTPPASPSPPPQDSAAMIAAIKPHLAQLIELASTAADPIESAALALDMLPEELDSAVYTLVSTPASFARLRLIEPRIMDHAEWFEKFRMAALAEFDKDNPEIP